MNLLKCYREREEMRILQSVELKEESIMELVFAWFLCLGGMTWLFLFI